MMSLRAHAMKEFLGVDFDGLRLLVMLFRSSAITSPASVGFHLIFEETQHFH